MTTRLEMTLKTLSQQGQEQIADIASRHGFSTAAVTHMLDAMVTGYGGMAQFNHPEFGGSGQWMDGGMTMVSDLFNHELKQRVDRLCVELAALVKRQPELARPAGMNVQTQSQFNQDGSEAQQGVVAGGGLQEGLLRQEASLYGAPQKPAQQNWWPASLGQPDSTGAQNESMYAWFSGPHRLALSNNGRVTVYDTLDHRISGVSQQQANGTPLSFTSQHGAVDLSSLPIVDEESERQKNDAQVYTQGSLQARSNQLGGNQQEEKAPVQQNHIALAEALSVETQRKDLTAGTAHVSQPGPVAKAPVAVAPAPASTDIFATIEKLAELRGKGVLSEQEFSDKKKELLDRL